MPAVPQYPDYPRSCDICGVSWAASQLKAIGDGKFACPDDFRGIHDKQMRALERSSKPFPPPVRPRKRPLKPTETPVYQLSEGRILNLIHRAMRGSTATYSHINVTNGDGSTSGTQDIQSNAWASEFLYQIISENKRPLIEINTCKTTLRTIADWLLSQQFGSPTKLNSYYTATTANVWYGGFPRTIPVTSDETRVVDNAIYSEDVAMGGLALLRAYQVHGGGAYLTGAKNAAHCLRRMQQGGRRVASSADGTYSTTSDGGTGRYDPGTWVEYMTITDDAEVAANAFQHGKFAHNLYVRDLVGLAFLSALRTVAGDISIGLTSALGGDFTGAADKLISEALALAKAFWTTGVGDNYTGTAKSGFSASTPYDYYDAFESTAGQTGDWQRTQDYPTAYWVNGRSFAKALWAWNEVYGFDSTVDAVWDWLMAFTSNSSFHTSATASKAAIADGKTGTYDPTLALATRLYVRNTADTAAMQTNGSSLYDWATTGLLAEIQSSQDRASFVDAKDALSRPRNRFASGNARDHEVDYLTLRAESGLTFQVGYLDSNNTRRWDVAGACMAGLAYRSAPQAFGLEAA